MPMVMDRPHDHQGEHGWRDRTAYGLHNSISDTHATDSMGHSDTASEQSSFARRYSDKGIVSTTGYVNATYGRSEARPRKQPAQVQQRVAPGHVQPKVVREHHQAARHGRPTSHPRPRTRLVRSTSFSSDAIACQSPASPESILVFMRQIHGSHSPDSPDSHVRRSLSPQPTSSSRSLPQQRPSPAESEAVRSLCYCEAKEQTDKPCSCGKTAQPEKKKWDRVPVPSQTDRGRKALPVRAVVGTPDDNSVDRVTYEERSGGGGGGAESAADDAEARVDQDEPPHKHRQSLAETEKEASVSDDEEEPSTSSIPHTTSPASRGAGRLSGGASSSVGDEAVPPRQVPSRNAGGSSIASGGSHSAPATVVSEKPVASDVFHVKDDVGGRDETSDCAVKKTAPEKNSCAIQ